MPTAVRLGAYNPGPMTGLGNHTYLVPRGNGRALLVDAGTGEARHLADLAAELRRLGAVLSEVVVTHGHDDHVAGAVTLAAAHPSARFYKWPWLEVDHRHAVPWRHPGVDFSFELENGERLDVVHTPGHSPDHVVLWAPASATLFSGDLVVPGSSVVIPWSRGGDMTQYLDALRRAIALAPRRLLASHGPEVHDPVTLLRAALDHRLNREEQVVERLAAGATTVEAIVESIYHGLSPALVVAARENVRAHLEKLRTDGRALQRGARWHLESR